MTTQKQWKHIHDRVQALLENRMTTVPEHLNTEHSYRSLALGVVSMDFKIAAISGITATGKGDYQKALNAIQLCEKLEEVRKWLVALPVEFCLDVPLEDYEKQENAETENIANLL